MRVPIEIEVPTPTVTITLPSNIPLMCDADEAERLFGLSRKTMDVMRRNHKDMPVKKIGHSVRYLVPDLYAWFRDYPGDIPVE